MASQTALIPLIPYPRKHLANLKRLTPLIIAGMEKEGLSMKSGEFDLGRLDAKLDTAYFYFIWVSQTNEVIDHLNLVIRDLRALPQNFAILGGSPWNRYELLVRTFFHEFYRFRELLNTVLSAVAKRGHITKEELTTARDAFHGALEHTIELRNSMVHQDVRFKGQRHFELTFATMLHARGMTAIHKRTGKAMTPELALSRVCGPTSRVLLREGKLAARLTRAFVRDTLAVM